MTTKALSRNRLNGDDETAVTTSTEATKVKKDKDAKKERVEIKPLALRTMKLRIRGITPFMQLRFGKKAIDKMMATQLAGSQAKSKRTREARDFDRDYEEAFHRLPDGSAGIPAAAIRAACISACRTVNFKMTLCKLSLFVEADGLDIVDDMPLIRLYGDPKKNISPVRNANGSADLRVRPIWNEWWADVRITFDQDQFSASDVCNLLARAGAQVGLGEGRPDSRASAGLGYGRFTIEIPEDTKA